jgi:hypothetical protein
VTSDEPEDTRRRTFFRVRVTVLLFVLAFVVIYAAYDIHSRRARNDWDHTLTIALVLVEQDAVDGAAVDALRQRLPALEARLASELSRYRPSAPKPFELRFFGPVEARGDLPRAAGDGVVDLAKHEWDLWRYLGEVDDRAHVQARAFDARIYIFARRPITEEHTFVEGESEENGRIGTVHVELNADMADMALELFHTLGATDKYDPTGRTLVPEGLVEPQLGAGAPQRFVEIMARTRPLGNGAEANPESLDEVAVGPGTAREIGWIR